MSILSKQSTILLVCALLIFIILRMLPDAPRYETGRIKPTMTQKQTPSPLPTRYVIPQRSLVVQTFNNCGPATLAMDLAYSGVSKTQEELGKSLRPWQNPAGINDDKSVFLPEMAREAEKYHLLAIHRPNGSILLLKTLIAHDIPVIVRTWLHDNEDIGHYRVIRGYDDTTKELIQDDSYIGGDLRYTYDDFLSIWKPFNYEYLVIAPAEKESLLKQILGQDNDERTAYREANKKAQKELAENPSDVLAAFNMSTSSYHLGEYEKSLSSYESVSSSLPNRTLWYQLEPLESYLKMKRYDAVLSLSETILANNNLAYSEIYLIRAKAYQELGQYDLAATEVNKAVQYNENLPAAKAAAEALRKNTPIQIDF